MVRALSPGQEHESTPLSVPSPLPLQAVFMIVRYRQLRFVSTDIRPMPVPPVESVSDTLDRILELR